MIDITRTVYIDILIGTNIIINYFILLAVSKYSKVIPKQQRMILGSVFGAVCSLIIFLPNLGFIINALLKLTVSIIIVLLTFGFHNFKTLIKNIALFYFISFCFCGIILFVRWVFNVIAKWIFFNDKFMCWFVYDEGKNEYVTFEALDTDTQIEIFRMLDDFLYDKNWSWV